MKDVQNLADVRGIPIQKVGVSDVHLPFLIKTKTGSFQSVLARIRLTVDLPQEYKGTHMSRFIEVLSDWSQKPVSNREMEAMLRDIMGRLGAQRAHIEIRFKYFIEKKAPVSGMPGLMDYTCRFVGYSDADDHVDLLSEVRVPISSVCPCSKEISDAGAHNQRGEVCLAIRFNKFVWIEDMIDLVEAAASCDVYSVLKRVDEKYVTEKGFDNPKFVEDVVRDVAQSVQEDPNITWYSVSAENFESIHNHSAYAFHVEDVLKPE